MNITIRRYLDLDLWNIRFKDRGELQVRFAPIAHVWFFIHGWMSFAYTDESELD